MVKLCHEKMLILRCIIPPPQKKINHLQKKINPHPLIKIERPDKKLYSLGVILIPCENLKPMEKYQPSPFPQFFFQFHRINSILTPRKNPNKSPPPPPKKMSDTS